MQDKLLGKRFKVCKLIFKSSKFASSQQTALIAPQRGCEAGGC